MNGRRNQAMRAVMTAGVVAVTGLFFLLSGCASTEVKQPPSEPQPDWITQPLQEEGQIYGIGNGESIDEARAMSLVDAGQQFGVSVRVAIEHHARENSDENNGERREKFTRMSEQLSDQRMYGARFADSWRNPDGEHWVLVWVPLDCVLDVAEAYMISYAMEMRQERPEIYRDIDEVVGSMLATVEQEVNQRFKIGDRGPAGGWIFYDKGNYSDGWCYLEAAPSDLDYRNWKGAQPQAEAHTVHGFSDWRLPDKEELNMMYENLHKRGVGGFADEVYWSSSKFLIFFAWYQYFKDGYQNASITFYYYARVRAVRAF